MIDVLIAIFCAIPVIGFVFWIDCKYGRKNSLQESQDANSIPKWWADGNISPPSDCYPQRMQPDTDNRSHTMADLTRKADALIRRKGKRKK